MSRRVSGIRTPAPALAAALLTVAILLSLLLFPGAAQAVSYETQELEAVRLINEYRQSLGLDPLMVSDLASDAAEKHGSDMAKYGLNPVNPHVTWQSDFFPEGANAGRRLALCGYMSGMGWGEIIAVGPRLATTAVGAWKGSPSHDRQMTEPSFNVMGVGLVYASGSEYGYWTIDFGIFVDGTAHWATDPPSSTTTTTAPPSTTTTTAPPDTTTTTTVPPASTTTTAPSSTTTTIGAPVVFADVKQSHPFYDAITSLARLGIVSGSNGLFHPDALVTRAQFAKIVVLALGRHTEAIDNRADPTFPDVPFTGVTYPFDFVEEAAALAIIQGREDGSFGPSVNVTRAQLALMLVRAGGSDLRRPPEGFSCPFVDVPAYVREAVSVAYYNELLNGKTATAFDPYSNATRGQVAKMVCGLYRELNE